MLLCQAAILVLLVTCHGAPVNEERDQRSPELESFGAYPAHPDQEEGQQALPQESTEREEEEEKLQEKVEEAGGDAVLAEKTDQQQASVIPEGSGIEDEKASVDTSEEIVLPESQEDEPSAEVNEDAVLAEDGEDMIEAEEEEGAKKLANENILSEDQLQQELASEETLPEDTLQYDPDVLNQAYSLYKELPIQDRSWYPRSSAYYNLLWGGGTRHRRSAPRRVALTAEDMTGSNSMTAARVKRGAYYPEQDLIDFDPRDLQQTDDWEKEEPFENMTEEELVRALKMLQKIYREELEKQQEHEAMEAMLEYEAYLNSLPDAPYPENDMAKRGYPMSLVSGAKRSSYDDWYYPRQEKRSYDNYYPTNEYGPERSEWFPDNEDLAGGWGQFIEDRRNEQEYERLMELADALGYQ